MDEYVEREALVHRLKSPYLFNITQRIFEIISETPAADVVPVVHARWVFGGDGCVICSECNEEESNDNHRNYCPNCGAKMDGGDSNAAD